jgi:hypothetical protein
MSNINIKDLTIKDKYLNLKTMSFKDTDAKISILLGCKDIRGYITEVYKLSNYHKIQLNEGGLSIRTYHFDDFIMTEYINPNNELRVLYYKGQMFSYKCKCPSSMSRDNRIVFMYKIYDFLRGLESKI